MNILRKARIFFLVLAFLHCVFTADEWLSGNGSGGTEINIGTFPSQTACIQQCSKTADPNTGVYANGATVTISGTPVTCFCEFGMTERDEGPYESAFIQPSCDNYLSLTEADRNFNSKVGVFCDIELEKNSYRFSGLAGTKMPTSCVQPYSCSTHAAGWMEGTNPTQSEGVVNRRVCFSWSGKCCFRNLPIRVRNCSSYYVYELTSTGACNFRFCGKN